jgi:hypothetical protein
MFISIQTYVAGRLAMMACVGFLVQEAFNPLHHEIGGMAVTHMQQVHAIDSSCSVSTQLGKCFCMKGEGYHYFQITKLRSSFD